MFLQVLLWLAPLLFLGRRDCCLRMLALQQQLEVYQRQQGGKRLQLTDEDRRFWVMLRRRWPRWRDALVIVKPETVVAWHRRLGRCWQRRQSRRPGRPPLPEHVQYLIRRMAAENPLWGQDRIAGDLGKLGLDVSPRSVAKYMGDRPAGPPSVGWMAFLRAEAPHIWACDWLRVKTIGFRTLYVFFVLAHERPRVVHFRIAEQPSDVWVAQQIVEATPFEDVPAFLIRDGDPLYSQTLSRRTWARGIHTIQIS
jgi:putative transposase